MCDRVCWIEKGKQRMIGPTDEVCEAYKALGR
jgi:ABC-2 type transport system ATP-binding protein